MVEAWLADEPSQSQGWRLLSELPATIYSGGRSCLVVQHSAGVDSRDRRNSLVFAVSKRDRIVLGLAKAASRGNGTRQRDGRRLYGVWSQARVRQSALIAAVDLIFSRVISVTNKFLFVAAWFWYAVVAAVLYGAHQIFTRMAADPSARASAGLSSKLPLHCRSSFTSCSSGWRALEPTIECTGNFLFRAYRHLRRRGNDCFLSAFSKGRSALFGSCDSGWRCGNYGHRRHLIFPRNTIVAADPRH